MRRRSTLASLAALATLTCREPTGGIDGAAIQLDIQYEAGSVAALDSGIVRIIGPTNKTIKVAPGQHVRIDSLRPGTYTVALQGFSGTEVANFGQTTGIQVTAGATAQASISFPTFVPTVPAPTPPASGRTFTVTWAAVANATGYVVQAATDAAFTQNLTSNTTTQTTLNVTAPTYGTYSVRVRATDPYQGPGAWSTTQSLQLVGAASGAQSTVAASATSIAAGVSTTITVTARDAGGVAVPGLTVVLAANGTGNTIVQPIGPTNASGVATGSFSSTAAQAKTISATAGGTAVTQTASVTVTPAAVSAAQSNVSANPNNITASTGSSAATITVTARDAFTNLIAGATVAIAAGGTGNTLAQPGPTNVSGITTGTLSSTVAEFKLVSATVNGVPITQTTSVTVAANGPDAAQSTVSANPTSIGAGDSSTITVTGKDAFGNLTQGASVSIAVSGSGNTVTQPATTTNASGVATGSFRSTVAETKTVSATIGGTPITQTATVTVFAIADLVVSAPSFSVTPTTIGQGLSVSLSGFQIVNRGTAATSGSLVLGWYLSTDSTLTDGVDTRLTAGPVGGLAPGDSLGVATRSLQIPDTTPPGRYFIGPLIDATNLTVESNEGNNFKSAALDVVVGSWTATGSLATPERDPVATLLPNGKVLMLLQNPSGTALYDPVTGTFGAANSTVVPRVSGHSATLLANGKVLIVGGSNSPQTAEIFDPVTGNFTATAGPPVRPRRYHSATLLADGRVLLAGGTTIVPDSTQAAAELYDPATNRFTATGSMTIDRALMAAVRLGDGRVLIAGGFFITQPGFGDQHRTAEIYNPATGTFSPTGSTQDPADQGVLLGDGRVLVIGCCAATGEVYNPATGTFTTTGSMTSFRAASTMTVLTDGRVLIAGGVSGTTFATCEIFDPVTALFLKAATMSTARQQHAAVRLLNGRVLVVGGAILGGGFLSSAELFSIP